jgi:hypothetical protein
VNINLKLEENKKIVFEGKGLEAFEKVDELLK